MQGKNTVLVVLPTPEEMFYKVVTYVGMLREAGFGFKYPQDPAFTRRLCSNQETIEQLSECDAVITGSKWFTKNILATLLRLRVIAPPDIDYDRVDVPAATGEDLNWSINLLDAKEGKWKENS